MNDSVSESYYSVLFDSVKKIPYYVVSGTQKSDLMTLASFVNVRIH